MKIRSTEAFLAIAALLATVAVLLVGYSFTLETEAGRTVMRFIAAMIGGCAASQIIVWVKECFVENKIELKLNELAGMFENQECGKFSSDESAVAKYRGKYHFYYKSWIGDSSWWRHLELDFRELISAGNLHCSFNVRHPIQRDKWFTYTCQAIVRGQSLVLLVEREKEEPAYYLFPHFCSGLDDHMHGLVYHQVWSNDTRLDPAMLSVGILHEQAEADGPFLTPDGAKRLEEKWKQEFFSARGKGLVANTNKIQLFKDKDVFFTGLLRITQQCDEVYTHMLSDPPASLNSPNSVSYFDNIHGLIAQNKFKVFQRIASVNSEAKAAWIFDTLYLLRDADAFFLAIRNVDHHNPLTSIHICIGSQAAWTFVWPTLDSTGSGQAFAVEDEPVARGMISEYAVEFRNQATIHLKTARRLHWPKIESLAEQFNQQKTATYEKLMQVKRDRGE